MDEAGSTRVYRGFSRQLFVSVSATVSRACFAGESSLVASPKLSGVQIVKLTPRCLSITTSVYRVSSTLCALYIYLWKDKLFESAVFILLSRACRREITSFREQKKKKNIPRVTYYGNILYMTCELCLWK